MKKKVLIALFGLFSFVFTSCSNDENTEDQIAGRTTDTIKLSQNEVNFSSASNSITITTQSKAWWLNGIGLNSDRIDVKKEDMLSENFKVIKSEFQVERKDGTNIIITFNPNKTNAERVLYVTLQAGNRFEQIRVLQSK